MATNELQEHKKHTTRKTVYKQSEKLEQTRRVVQLNSQCWTQERIAKELNISQATVSAILKGVAEKYWTSILDERNQEVVSQVSRLNYLIEEAMQGWERSKEASKAVSKKTDTIIPAPTQNSANTTAIQKQPQAIAESTVIKSIGQVGDLSYFEDIRDSLADIRKLLGIDAPTKTEQKIDLYSRLNDDDLDTLILEDATTPKTRGSR